MMMRIMAGVGLALLGLGCASGGAGRQPEEVGFDVRGVVVDARTGEPVPRVSVRLPELRIGVMTDTAGAFRIRGHALPGRYGFTAARVGYTAVHRRIHIRRAGTVGLGTLAMRPYVLRLSHLIAAGCLHHDRPPADTAPGTRVRAHTDSAGTFWIVCGPAAP